MQQLILTAQSPPAAAHDAHDEAKSTILLGFWIYLMSDCILFAALFATYVVLSGATAGGPAPKDLFDLSYVLIETFCLLASSFTCGLAMLAVSKNRDGEVLAWLVVTLLLGVAFIGMELNEFHRLVVEGYRPDTSSFLSAFFTLVGTHGLHVTAGLIWVTLLMAQVLQRGLTATSASRLMCFSLFWHFLDIIWIGVFTVVYLRGAIA